MSRVSAVLLVLLPLAVLFAGGWTMDRIAGRQYAKDQLLEKAAAGDQRSLNLRPMGYDPAAVTRHWGALDDTALAAEQRFMELDLVFPFVYGAVLAGALLFVRAALGRPFSPAWIIAAVLVTAVADWSENLILLSQLQTYLANQRTGLQDGWIRIASAATVLKLVLFFGSWLALACLAFVANRRTA